MEVLFLILSILGTTAILITRDNVLAAFSLLGIGIAVAGYAAAMGLPALFLLVALAYIASALVLVIVAAAAISEDKVKMRLTPYAALPLLLLLALLLPEGPTLKAALPDSQVLYPSAAFILFMLLIAVELARR